MSDLGNLVNRINEQAETSNRIIVAIAGGPGSGKSTLVAKLQKSLDNAVVVPMDGFHLDNVILEERKLMPRKGSPSSFDAEGYIHLIARLKNAQETVYAPIFDRASDLSKAGAIEIPQAAKVILTEGNYLLLDQHPWDKLTSLYDLSVFLDVPASTLKQRLINRWLDYGLSSKKALARAESNDLLNADLVTQLSKAADIIIKDF